VLYLFPQAGTGLRPAEEQKTLERFGEEAEIGEEFFIWIRCNPLKSPDSAKEIQAFLLGFIWFCLDLFGANTGHAR
jgi:hypothetical protein